MTRGDDSASAAARPSSSSTNRPSVSRRRSAGERIREARTLPGPNFPQRARRSRSRSRAGDWRSGTRYLPALVAAAASSRLRRYFPAPSHPSLQRLAERGFGVVPDFRRHVGDADGAAAEQRGRTADPPAREYASGDSSTSSVKRAAKAERDMPIRGERLHRPGGFGTLTHQGAPGRFLGIEQSAQPSLRLRARLRQAAPPARQDVANTLTTVCGAGSGRLFPRRRTGGSPRATARGARIALDEDHRRQRRDEAQRIGVLDVKPAAGTD